MTSPALDWLVAFGGLILTLIIAAFVLAILLLALSYQRLKRIDLPEDADFWTAIRAVPLFLALAIDLLDFSLDILSAPIGWLVLNHFGLTSLRNTAAVEMLIPFTQPIPTMTAAWLIARFTDVGKEDSPALRIGTEATREREGGKSLPGRSQDPH